MNRQSLSVKVNLSQAGLGSDDLGKTAVELGTKLPDSLATEIPRPHSTGQSLATLFAKPLQLSDLSIMASDEIVWQIINQQFCSFKLK